jgi:glycosyltransferase involved in cell wall biosynthesis/O-antigen/teichoic acid export membrane protein
MIRGTVILSALAGVTQLIALVQQAYVIRQLGFGETIDAFYLGDAPAEVLRVMLSAAVPVLAMPHFVGMVESPYRWGLTRIGDTAAVVLLTFGAGGALLGSRIALTTAITAVTITLTVRMVLQVSSAQARQAFLGPACALAAGALVGLGLVAVGVKHWPDVGLAVGFAIGQLASYGFLTLVIRRSPRLSAGDAPTAGYRETLKKALPVAFATGISRINVLVDRVFAAALLPAGDVGVLALASKLAVLPQLLLGTPMATAAYPDMVKRSPEPTYRRYVSGLVWRSAALSATATVLGFAVLAVGGIHVLDLTSGERTRLLTTVACFGGLLVFAGAGSLLARAQYAQGRSGLLLAWATFEAVLNVVLDVVLGSMFGVQGLAMATSLTALMGVGLLVLLLRIPVSGRPRRLVVLPELRLGGGQLMALDRARQARERGETVLVLALAPSIGADVRERAADLRTLSLPWGSARLGGLAVLGLTAAWRPDVIEGHLPPADEIVAGIGRRLRVSTAVMIHGFPIDANGDPLDDTPRYAAKIFRADAVLVPSRALRDVALRLGAAVDQVVVAPYRVATRRITPEDRVDARRAAGLHPDALAVVTVARVEPRKGVRELIEAFAIVHAALPQAKLFVVGDENPDTPSYSDQLDEVIRTRGLAEAVIRVGAVADPFPWLALADCFAIASKTEGWCIAATEAEGAGLPVVATNVGGLPEAAPGARLVPQVWAPELTEVPVEEFAAALILALRPG